VLGAKWFWAKMKPSLMSLRLFWLVRVILLGWFLDDTIESLRSVSEDLRTPYSVLLLCELLTEF